jgi:putative transposase
MGIGSETMNRQSGMQHSFPRHAHVVLVTKYRRGVLSRHAIRDLRNVFASVCEAFEAKLVTCTGDDNQVYRLVSYPPRTSLSGLVSIMKATSTRKLRGPRPEVSGDRHRGIVWSPHYFTAFSAAAAHSPISEYVRNVDAGAKMPQLRRGGSKLP